MRQSREEKTYFFLRSRTYCSAAVTAFCRASILELPGLKSPNSCVVRSGKSIWTNAVHLPSVRNTGVSLMVASKYLHAIAPKVVDILLRSGRRSLLRGEGRHLQVGWQIEVPSCHSLRFPALRYFSPLPHFTSRMLDGGSSLVDFARLSKDAC